MQQLLNSLSSNVTYNLPLIYYIKLRISGDYTEIRRQKAFACNFEWQIYWVKRDNFHSSHYTLIAIVFQRFNCKHATPQTQKPYSHIKITSGKGLKDILFAIRLHAVYMYVSKYVNMFILYVCTSVLISFYVPLNPYLLKYPLLMSPISASRPDKLLDGQRL